MLLSRDIYSSHFELEKNQLGMKSKQNVLIDPYVVDFCVLFPIFSHKQEEFFCFYLLRNVTVLSIGFYHILLGFFCNCSVSLNISAVQLKWDTVDRNISAKAQKES